MKNLKCKKVLKKTGVILLALIMTLSTFSVVFAANSINKNTNNPVVPGTGEWTSEGFVVIRGSNGVDGVISADVDTSTYKEEKVVDLVEKVNSGEDIEVADYIKELPEFEGKTDPENYPTTKGYDINLKLYDRITKFFEIKNFEDGTLVNDAPGIVELKVPDCIGMKGSDLMVLIIDSETGEMYLVPLEEFDSETGTMKVDLPCVGPYCIIHKIPIIDKNISPDLYPSEGLAEKIKQLNVEEVITLSEFLKTLGVENLDTLEVAEGVEVSVDDYSSATALADVALELGYGEYSYDLNTKFEADLYIGNEKADYERILDYAGVEYDKEAAEENDEVLTEIEPFVLEDSFVYHIDAKTEEVSIIYEPTVCWNSYGNMLVETKEMLTEDEVLTMDVKDIESEQTVDEINTEDNEEGMKLIQEAYAAGGTLSSDDNICFIMHGDEYIGMGPFILFMPKEDSSFPWWILLILLLAVIFYIIYKKRKDEKEEEA